MKFMVIGLPRSGTTWAANWLTTDYCLVKHDPLYSAHYTDWNRRYAAVSCTGIWRWPEWVNAQRCPKIILHRDRREVALSLHQLGAGDAINDYVDQLNDINGFHVQWTDLFEKDRAWNIWNHVYPSGDNDLEFCPHRHKNCVEMNVQPQLSRIHPDAATTLRLVDELFDIAKRRR